ncbi:MAG: hypothetical protein NVSMB32_04620 [Actinomycetota bacterium]
MQNVLKRYEISAADIVEVKTRAIGLGKGPDVVAVRCSGSKHFVGIHASVGSNRRDIERMVAPLLTGLNDSSWQQYGAQTRDSTPQILVAFGGRSWCSPSVTFPFHGHRLGP